MDQSLRSLVRRRAGDVCEYCRLAAVFVTVRPLPYRAILSGKPCNRGMRLTVMRVTDALSIDPDRIAARLYLELEDEDIQSLGSHIGATAHASGHLSRAAVGDTQPGKSSNCSD